MQGGVDKRSNRFRRGSAYLRRYGWTWRRECSQWRSPYPTENEDFVLLDKNRAIMVEILIDPTGFRESCQIQERDA
jgi:hypothetical protein